MSKFDIKYIPGISFPNTILNIAKDVCNQCGVELGNTNFRNADKVINANPFTNAEQCREVIKSIAKISFSCGHVWQDNKLYFGFDVVNNVVSEEITSDNYFETEKNNEIKPITVITLRSSEVAASGQSIRNENLIKQYGENELIIEEDYFAFTDTLRQSFLQEANVLFGLTYHPISIDLEGSVYLSFNDVIKITNLNNEVIKTYCLNNTHTYNGVLYNSVSTPALTETEEKYIYKDEDKTKRTKTAIEIDKANKKITEIVEDVSGHETRIAKTETDINGIKNTVSKTTEIVDELSKDVQVYSVDLDTYSIVIPTDGKQYPFEDKSYRVNFYTYFKGKQVNSIVTTASSNEGITCDINSYINLSVKKETKISNLTNEFIINFIYEDEDKNPYTVSKKIVITLGISEIPKSFLNARIDESVKLEESGNNKLKALNKLEGKTEQETRSGKNLFDIGLWEDAKLSGTGIGSSGTGGTITVKDKNITIENQNGGDIYTNTGMTVTGLTVSVGLRKYLMKVEPNTSYVLSFDVDGTAHSGHANSSYYSLIDENYVCISYASLGSFKVPSSKHTKVITTTANTKYIGIRFGTLQATGVKRIYSNIQFEKGTVATEYEAYGASPTPNFPSDVKTVTGDVNVSIYNNNLVDFANPTYATSADFTFENDVLTVYSTNKTHLDYNQIQYDITDFVNAHKGEKFYFKEEGLDISKYTATNSGIVMTVMTVNDKKQYSTLLNKLGTKTPLTIPEGNITNAKLNIFVNNTSTKGVDSTVVITKPRLSIVNDENYVPHQSQVFPLTLGSLELCKIGDYADYIYRNGSKWFKRSYVGKVVFDGSESYGKSSTTKVNAFVVKDYLQMGKYNCISSHFEYKRNIGVNENFINSILYNTGVNQTYLIFDINAEQNTVANLQTWLSNNNVTNYYLLATPTDTEITDTTLIAQLNALENAQLYEGITNITITGDNLTPIADIDYWTWYKGNEGDKGDTGEAGKDGTSTYFYVRYSANSNGNPMTTSPSSTTQYMGVASTTSSTAPTSYSAYTWSKIKGEQGTSGTPGTAGKDGKTTYLHIKYSEDGINFTPADDDFALGEKPSAYIGQYTDFTEADSSNFADYSWYKFTQNIDAELNQMQSDISQNATDIENKYQDVIEKMDNFATEDNLVAIEQRVETIEKDNSYNINIIKDIQVNGASKVKTETGYTFDNDGLTIEKTGAKVKSKLDEAGLEIKDATGSSDESLLYAGYDEELGETIVKSKNMTVEKYLVIGKYSRMEDFTDSNGNIGTGMFWIGG